MSETTGAAQIRARRGGDWCPAYATMVDVLREQARRRPEQCAFIFLREDLVEERHLTYAALDQQARAIAALLQSVGAPGERVLLLYPQGLDYICAFFGCLYAGAVAVPLYPPRLSRPDPRLRAVLGDAQPAALLTTAPIIADLERTQSLHPGLERARWLCIDNLADGWADAWLPPRIDGQTLAFLQYTSGSTSLPKGVMVSHANLLYQSVELDIGLEHTADSVMVSWLPIFHDMGLIFGVLQPLYQGYPCVLMSPPAFLQKPARWLQAISRYRATHSAAPNFAYDLCLSRVTPEQRAALDLGSWTVALNGAEPIRQATLARFAEAFAACGFRPHALCPGYGLAEATLGVAHSPYDEAAVCCTVRAADLEQRRVVALPDQHPEGRVLVSSGRPTLETQVWIVDPERRTRCAPDEVGEIWVGGPTVAQGYWGRAEESCHSFRAYLADTGEGPFLRTGDLGFVRGDELYVTGRLKDVIIIDGRNHYPQDIELTVEQSHPAIRAGCVAAFAVDVQGAERLVVAAELTREYRPQRMPDVAAADSDAVAGAVRRAIAHNHELEPHDIVLLRTGSIPKTSSGKIQRRPCRARYLDDTLEVWGRSADAGSEGGAGARARRPASSSRPAAPDP